LNIIEEYDTDKDNFLVLDDFLKFYRKAAIEREYVVR